MTVDQLLIIYFQGSNLQPWFICIGYCNNINWTNLLLHALAGKAIVITTMTVFCFIICSCIVLPPVAHGGLVCVKWNVSLESQKFKHLANCWVVCTNQKSNELPASMVNVCYQAVEILSFFFWLFWTFTHKMRHWVMMIMKHAAFTDFQETTITEIKQKIMKIPDANGIIIDGFPRDVGQALSFEDQVSFSQERRFHTLSRWSPYLETSLTVYFHTRNWMSYQWASATLENIKSLYVGRWQM